MDANDLRDEALVGRKVWVEGTLLTSSRVNVFGNVTVSFMTPTPRGGVVQTKVFVRPDSIVKFAPRELKVGDTVQWTQEEGGGLDMRGELLWFDDELVLVRWPGFPGPEISKRDWVELAEGTT